ncbi:MAG: nitroreductase family deazaflavin-dependent oxidoreductase [Actinomycetota bacterium]
MQDLDGHQFCYLTTVGRRTGRRHEIEIWYAAAPDGATLYLLSGGGDRADWVRNLAANPGVDVRLGAVTYRAIARILDQAGDEEQTARRLVFEKYDPGYDGDLSRWRARSLPLALDLSEERTPG